jgi:hypothetical protein
VPNIAFTAFSFVQHNVGVHSCGGDMPVGVQCIGEQTLFDRHDSSNDHTGQATLAGGGVAVEHVSALCQRAHVIANDGHHPYVAPPPSHMFRTKFALVYGSVIRMKVYDLIRQIILIIMQKIFAILCSRFAFYAPYSSQLRGHTRVVLQRHRTRIRLNWVLDHVEIICINV